MLLMRSKMVSKGLRSNEQKLLIIKLESFVGSISVFV